MVVGENRLERMTCGPRDQSTERRQWTRDGKTWLKDCRNEIAQNEVFGVRRMQRCMMHRDGYVCVRLAAELKNGWENMTREALGTQCCGREYWFNCVKMC